MFNFAAMLFNFLVIVTTPTVAAAVARNDFKKASPSILYGFVLARQTTLYRIASYLDTSLQASRTTAQGLWVAVVFGTLAGLGIYFGAPFLLQKINSSPEVTVHALAYLRCRAVACPALLSMFVATGSFRGFQDTK
jgi:Na+-driven multidrug efflux pump